MPARTSCLLKNEELVRTIVKLKDELFNDFSENLLKKCNKCAAGLEEKKSEAIHQTLISIYNHLSDIKRML